MAETMNVTAATTETETPEVTNAELADAYAHLEQAFQTFVRMHDQLTRRGVQNDFIADFLLNINEDDYGVEFRFWSFWRDAQPQASAVEREYDTQAEGDDDEDDDE